MTEYGFKGALINGFTHVGDDAQYLDDPALREFWAKVEQPKVPVSSCILVSPCRPNAVPGRATRSWWVRPGALVMKPASTQCACCAPHAAPPGPVRGSAAQGHKTLGQKKRALLSARFFVTGVTA